jgi:hypothetical protein
MAAVAESTGMHVGGGGRASTARTPDMGGPVAARHPGYRSPNIADRYDDAEATQSPPSPGG